MRCVLVLILMAIVGCQGHSGAASSDQITSDCPRVLEQARSVGVDYVPTLRKAASGDDAALATLLDLTGSDHLDTAAQQCHIEALAELLSRLGDRHFASALAAEPPEVRRAVVNGLIIELSNLASADASRLAFADRYPRTAGCLSP